MAQHPIENFVATRVEPIHPPTADQAEKVRAAGYNPALMAAEDIWLDLFTDSGTGGMSVQQDAAMAAADESYANSRSARRFRDTIQRVYGYTHVTPAHQGRGAENLLARALLLPGDVVAGNMYFPSTLAHLDLNGAVFRDVIVDEAHDPASRYPFKGNVDLSKLDSVLAEHGAAVSALWIGATVNMAGGQPISIANLTAVRQRLRGSGLPIPIVLDAARAVENCYLIQAREPGWSTKPVAEILRALTGLSDAATMSAKKDSYAHIGGWVGIRATHSSDPTALATRLSAATEHVLEDVHAYEGHYSYGGLAGRDLEAVAVGVEESVLDENIRTRVEQVHYLGDTLIEAGVPVVQPLGGHAVYLNAAEILRHIPREHFPAQTLVAALAMGGPSWRGGIRSVERGSVSAGRDPATGRNRSSTLELVRLAIPRRRFTQSQIDEVARQVTAIAADPGQITSGLTFTFEPKRLRFFRARFAPAAGRSILADDEHRAA